MKNGNHWAGLLAYVIGLINQELLLQNEYLAAENRILRAHLPARLRLSDPERYTLAEIGKRLGRKALEKVACVAKPDTILAWYRRLIARKFDGSHCRTYPGRPRISAVVEHYHGERNHQGKANQLLLPRPAPAKCTSGGVRCQQRLGGLLKYYYQEAA